jgi:hypothetical protein
MDGHGAIAIGRRVGYHVLSLGVALISHAGNRVTLSGMPLQRLLAKIIHDPLDVGSHPGALLLRTLTCLALLAELLAQRDRLVSGSTHAFASCGLPWPLTNDKARWSA